MLSGSLLSIIPSLDIVYMPELLSYTNLNERGLCITYFAIIV